MYSVNGMSVMRNGEVKGYDDDLVVVEVASEISDIRRSSIPLERYVKRRHWIRARCPRLRPTERIKRPKNSRAVT
jgi:hypothetical protein